MLEPGLWLGIQLVSKIDREAVGAGACVVQPVLHTDLHTCLDDIQWRVAEHTGSSCKATKAGSDQRVDVLVWVIATVPVSQRVHDKETDGLVATLLHDGG